MKTTELKITGITRKIPTTGPAFDKVKDWFLNNSGNFPGKVTLKAMTGGKSAYVMVEDQPIGILQSNDGKPYPCTEFNFDDKGICTDDYVVSIMGPVASTPSALHTAIIKHIIETTNTEVDVDMSRFHADIQRIVNAGICNEATVVENIGIMLQNEVPDKIIKAVLAQYKTWERPVCKPKTTYVSVNHDGYMKRALTSALEGFAVVFEGGQSVGKNVMAETIAKVMHKPYYLITLSADMTSADVFGSKSTDNSAGAKLTMELARAAQKDTQAQIEYDLYKAQAASVRIVLDDSEFCDWLEHGGVMCFNEMNLADANLFGSFANQIADGTGFIFIPGRGRIYVNKDCTLIGTQNPGFEGTLTQNQATMSRFGCINFGYPKEIVGPLKAALKDIADEVPATIFTQVNKLYMECLAAVQSGEIGDACLNIRGFARAIRCAYLWDDDLQQQIMMQVVNTCPKEDVAMLAQKVSLHFE